MMRRIFFTIAILLFSWNVFSQGIQFEIGSWKEVLQKAKQENKLIFVDLYTTWCGPCKKMAAETFPQQAVGDYFNKNFVNYKIDAEKGEGPELAGKYEVSAYPTLVFVNAASELVYKFMGVRTADKLIAEGEKAVRLYALAPSIAAMEKEYEQGKRGKVFLGEYYALLKESGAGGGIVLNEYLKCLSDEELLLEENVSNIGNISIFDPVLFDRLVKGIKKVEGENKKLGNRLNTSVMKSLSACFATCVKEKDEKALEGILGVKAGLGNLENGMSAMMGGGKSYLPAEQLRLDFYSNNRLDDKFKTLMSEYMIAQQQENSIDSLRKTEEITNRHFEMLIDSARMKNDSAAIVSIRKTMGMASLFGGVKYKLLSSFVISATRHYWKITDQQNVGEKKKCIAWVNYAYQLDRTPATAWGCADLLEEIGEKQGAKKLLNDVLEVIKNNSLSDADPKDIQSVTERVEKM